MTRLQTIITPDHELLSPCSIEIKLAAGSAGEIVGYASTFDDHPDSHGDVVAPGAFIAGLEEHRSNGTAPAMLWTHNPAEPVGRWLSLDEDSVGLRAHGKLNLETRAGREAYAHVKAGDVTGLSIGFNRTVRKLNSDGTRRILSMKLHEISLVTTPSNERARVREVKHIGSPRELEDLLTGAGLPRGAAKKVAAGGFGALGGASAASVPDPDDWRRLEKRLASYTQEIRSYRK